MKITGYESEQTVLKELGVRIKQHRILMNLTQAELADRCGISSSTEVRIENGIDSRFSSYIRILSALGLLQNLDLLIPEPQPDFKALFEQKPTRQRVRSKKEEPKSGWVWGEDK